MNKYEHFLKHKFISDPNKGLLEEKSCNEGRLEKTEENGLNSSCVA